MYKKLQSCEVGPNYQFIDGLRSIWATILLPFEGFLFEKNKISCKQKLSKYLSLDFGSDSSLKTSSKFSSNFELKLTASGRTSLYLLLQSLNLSAGSQVLFQAFTCVVLPNAIMQAGMVPVAVDVNQKNYNFDITDLEKQITNKTKIIIIQYTFGLTPNEQDMAKIVDLCNKYQLILIEDLAHSLGAKVKLDGKNVAVGRVGHGAIISFGRDKIISSTTGGGHFLNSENRMKYQPDFKNWVVELKKLENKTLRAASKFQTLQALSYVWLTAFIIRPMYHIGIGKAVLIMAKKIGLIGKIYTPQEEIGTSKLQSPARFSPALAYVLSHQIDKLNLFTTHRQQVAKIYSSMLGLPFNQYASYLRFPLHFDTTKECEEVKAKLKKQGILAGLWYNGVMLPAKFDLQKNLDYSLGDLPSAEFLGDNRTLNLPTNIHTSKADAENIAKIIKQTIFDKTQI